MTVAGWAQIVLFVVVLTALVKPLGTYIAGVFTRPPTARERRLLRPERQDWKAYARSTIVFSGLCMLALYALLRLQRGDLGPGTWDLSFNTAASFVSNTSWQFYAGETTLTAFSQMAGIALHSYLSAGVGLAVAAAVIRGFAARGTPALGNFWLDLWRGLAYVILPLTALGTLLFLTQGVVQSSDLPVATWAAIKTLGSVGGGFFNVNSAMPFENATGLSSFVQALLIVLVPAALTHTFGRLAGSRRQGWALYGVMLSLFLVAVAVTYAAETQTTAAQAAAGLHGGNLEGKEQRFGAAGTALYAVATTTGSSGAVNGAMESLTPLGGLVVVTSMATGEVIFGGIGAGLYGMLLTVLLGVFLAGLMVGRTPEYLGKTLGIREMKLVVIGTIGVPCLVLAFAAVAVATGYGRASIYAGGPQGFAESVYAYVSQAFNNGSAYAGYTGYVQPNAPGNAGAYGITFADLAGGLIMLLGRYAPMIAALAVAGSLATRRVRPASLGTLRTDSLTFAAVLVGVIVLVALLTFVPAFALGPGAQALTDRLVLALQRKLDDERGRLVGQRLDPDLAAVGLDEATHDRQPEAGAAVAGGGGAGAVEGLEDPFALGLWDARAAVDEAQHDAAADVASPHRDGVAVRVPVGVLQQVGERALELRGVGADRRQVGVDRDLEGVARKVEVVDRGPDDLLDRAPLRVGLGGVGFQAREVEQVVDQAREPARLDADGLGELAPLRVGQARRAQRLGAGQDRGQRRAEIVRDRAQERGLDHVAAPQGGGLHDLGLQRVAFQRGRQQRLQRRRDADLHAPQHGLGRARGQHERADLARALTQREDDAALGRVDRAQLDRRAAQPKRLRDPCTDGRERLLEPPAAAQQQARHLRRQVGLLPALVGLELALARDLREPARPRRREEEDREADPVLPRRDREAPGRRDVEEVERERAQRPRSRAPATRPRRSPPRARPAGTRRPATGRARRP